MSGAVSEEARVARLELIAEDAAAMAVRREVLKVSAAARRYAGNQEAWQAWLSHFYASEHPRVLRERLHLTTAQADEYCRQHRAAMLSNGLRMLAEWEQRCGAELLALALT